MSPPPPPPPPSIFPVLASLAFCNAADAVHMTSFNYLRDSSSFLEAFSFNGGIDATSSLLFVGMFFGGLVALVFGDITGRRSLLLSSLLLSSLASGLAVFSPSILVFNALRLLNGLAVGAMIPPVFAICNEASPDESRGRNVNHVCWFFLYGSVYISLVAYNIFERTGEDDWRLFQFFTALPSIVALALVNVYVKVRREGGV